jgi:hypothetical protein
MFRTLLRFWFLVFTIVLGSAVGYRPAKAEPARRFALLLDQPGVSTTILSDGAGVMQALRGAAARAYVASIYAENPRFRAAHEKTAGHLKSLGFEPTEHVFVARHLYTAPSRSTMIRTVAVNPKLTPIQTFETYGDNSDVIFTSYDDGDWSHWVGEFSAINHTQNAWADYSAEHDDSDESTIFRQVNWAYLEEDSEGGGGHYISTTPQADAALRLRAVQDRHPDVWYGNQSPRATLVRWRGNYRGDYGCAAEGCSAAAGTSLFFGPGAPEEFFGGCTFVLIYCGWGNLWDNWA